MAVHGIDKRWFKQNTTDTIVCSNMHGNMAAHVMIFDDDISIVNNTPISIRRIWRNDYFVDDDLSVYGGGSDAIAIERDSI